MDIITGSQPQQRSPLASIGTKWAPSAVQRSDSSRGFFEAVNPHATTVGDICVQRALLKQASDDMMRRVARAQGAARVGQALMAQQERDALAARIAARVQARGVLQ